MGWPARLGQVLAFSGAEEAMRFWEAIRREAEAAGAAAEDLTRQVRRLLALRPSAEAEKSSTRDPSRPAAVPRAEDEKIFAPGRHYCCAGDSAVSDDEAGAPFPQQEVLSASRPACGSDVAVPESLFSSSSISSISREQHSSSDEFSSLPHPKSVLKKPLSVAMGLMVWLMRENTSAQNSPLRIACERGDAQKKTV